MSNKRKRRTEEWRRRREAKEEQGREKQELGEILKHVRGR